MTDAHLTRVIGTRRSCAEAQAALQAAGGVISTAVATLQAK